MKRGAGQWSHSPPCKKVPHWLLKILKISTLNYDLICFWSRNHKELNKALRKLLYYSKIINQLNLRDC